MKRAIFLSVTVWLSIISPAKAVVFDDGQRHSIDYTINDTVWVDQHVSNNPGTQIELADGGWVTQDIWAYHNSTVIVNGGRIDEELRPYDNTALTITRGTVYTILAFDNSNVTVAGGLIQDSFSCSSTAVISGGTIGNSLDVYWNGTINLVGSTFSVDSIPLSYGDNLRDYSTPGLDPWGNSCLTGTVAGMLSDGSPLNNNFYIHEDGNIFLVPEPSTLLLLGLGLVMLRRKNNK